MSIFVRVTFGEIMAPAEIVPVATRFTLVPVSGVTMVQDVDYPNESVAFDVTTPGTYDLSAHAITAEGVPVGEPVLTTVTIDEPATVLIRVPTAITAEVF